MSLLRLPDRLRQLDACREVRTQPVMVRGNGECRGREGGDEDDHERELFSRVST
jgi:hypothetical protein